MLFDFIGSIIKRLPLVSEETFVFKTVKTVRSFEVGLLHCGMAISLWVPESGMQRFG